MKYLPATAVFLLMVSTGMSLDRREFIANWRRPSATRTDTSASRYCSPSRTSKMPSARSPAIAAYALAAPLMMALYAKWMRRSDQQLT